MRFGTSAGLGPAIPGKQRLRCSDDTLPAWNASDLKPQASMQHFASQAGEFLAALIDGRSVHPAEDAIWYVGRARDLEKMMTADVIQGSDTPLAPITLLHSFSDI